jgi:hypothetical protein
MANAVSTAITTNPETALPTPTITQSHQDKSTRSIGVPRDGHLPRPDMPQGYVRIVATEPGHLPALRPDSSRQLGELAVDDPISLLSRLGISQ